jgi:hypothetical protein
MTAPSEFETTPLTGDTSWLEAYAEARASTRWTVVDRANAAPNRSMPWPWMVRLYDGWQLEEPEPKLKARL